jgi:erythromycin esterase
VHAKDFRIEAIGRMPVYNTNTHEVQLNVHNMDTRIVVAYHNIHIQKTPVNHEGAVPLLPQGYHLAQALGDAYIAIAATSKGGRTARMHMNPEHPQGFEVHDLPLSPPAEGSIEAAFPTETPLAVADLRAARPGIVDVESFQRMRMEDFFVDVSIFDAFDAIACVTHTSVSEMEQ